MKLNALSFWLTIVILTGLFSVKSAQSHQLSTAYLTLNIDQEKPLQGQLQIRWFDLHLALGLDNNLDGKLLWQEVLSRQQAIDSYLSKNLSIKRGENTCRLDIDKAHQTEQHFDEGYLVANFASKCKTSAELTVTYSGIFQQDSEHKLLLNVNGTQQFSAVLSNQVKAVSFEMGQTSWLDTFIVYLHQGILHIWKGIDHVLFLLALLLTCVLQRKEKKWIAKDDISTTIRDTAWIVTAFTLAHSITLTSVAMNWLPANSRWVEFGIAVSVLFTALNNIWPMVLRLGWLTFAFGLLHGMGFAGVLGQLGLASEQRLLSVLAFNLGVEVGQLAILLVLIPLLLMLKNRTWYRRYGVKFASALIGIIAIQWSIERF